MRTSSIAILALATLTTSTVVPHASSSDLQSPIFTCINPEPYCCDFFTDSGLGINCQQPHIWNITDLFAGFKAANDTQAPLVWPTDSSPFVSVCYVPIPAVERPRVIDQVALCCKDAIFVTTSDLIVHECIPAQQYIGTLDHAGYSLILANGTTYPARGSDALTGRGEDTDTAEAFGPGPLPACCHDTPPSCDHGRHPSACSERHG